MSDISAKLQYLVDSDDIRRLMHRYAKAIDRRDPPETVADLFVDDASWSGPRGFGERHGREELIALFKEMADNVIFSVHAFGNEQIDVDGDHATGSWTTIIPYTFREELRTQDHWAFLRYNNSFVQRDGKWLISEMRLQRLADGPHQLGWIDSVF